MHSKINKIRNWLIEISDKSILFVGIGNVLKSDDGVGVYISRGIREVNRLSALTVEVSIENYIGKINSLNPDVLILVDCMELGKPAGSFDLFRIDEVEDGTFNTHNISLSRLEDFFTMPVFILGVQPKKIDFGETLSEIVKDTADKILLLINNKEVSHG